MLENASCAQRVKSLKDLLGLLPQNRPVIGSLPNRGGSLESLAHRIQDSVLIVLAR